MRSTVLYLHIGLMKTGTTYLQRALRDATAELKAEGVGQYPATQIDGHRMSKALREVSIGAAPDRAGRAALKKMPSHLSSTSARATLISEEALSFADDATIQRLGEMIGDRETHVIMTVRNLAKIIPSTWQERIKVGREMGFQRYCAVIAKPESRVGSTFWHRQDMAAVARRWEALVPPERIHVVTAPAVTVDRRLLLSRFCSVLGVDPAVVPDSSSLVNESLGYAQTELLRRVNQALPPGLTEHETHSTVVKRMFAETILSGQGGKGPSMSESYRDFCAEQTRRMVEEMSGRGYQVVGDLADLDAPDSFFAATAAPESDDVIGAAAGAIVELLEREAARQ